MNMARIKLRTSGVNLAGIFGLVTAVVVVGLGAWILQDQQSATPPITSDQERPRLDTTNPVQPTTTTSQSAIPKGVYAPYTSQVLQTIPPNAKAVLFFTADTCTSCVELDTSIAANRDSIPANVRIYRVQYNQAEELRARYQVSAPHTFVEIDSVGKMVEKWRGSQTLASILSHL
jgi:hypothetical protein